MIAALQRNANRLQFKSLQPLEFSGRFSFASPSPQQEAPCRGGTQSACTGRFIDFSLAAQAVEGNADAATRQDLDVRRLPGIPGYKTAFHVHHVLGGQHPATSSRPGAIPCGRAQPSEHAGYRGEPERPDIADLAAYYGGDGK